MNLAAIPAHVPFLDTVAARWLARFGGGLSQGLILLPTRRAARSLADAFLRVSGGQPLLLPRIAAIGALDEAPLTLAGALDLPPAVEPAHRLAVLSRLILALPEAQGGVRTADRAWMLARELAVLMDEAECAELDLPAALRDAADVEHAQHWDVTLRFLDIVTRAWPAWLDEQGLMNPATRQIRLLRAQAEAWESQAPGEPVWVAGTTGGIKAVARLLRVVARLDGGMVVLPGLDRDLPNETWDALDTAHPQAGLRELLKGLGATRDDVAPWDGESPVPAGRVRTLSQAMLPAAALKSWRNPVAVETANLFRLEAADQQEEAAAIALILRDALARPGARGALVTPDRVLAGRVAAELLRWGVVADDSAGEALAETPPALFLRLLARAMADGLAPVPLLSLLKHPLAAAGMAPAQCRAAARALERACLRGPRPAPGLTGLRRALGDAKSLPQDLLARLEVCLEPLLRVAAGVSVAPQAVLDALIEAAEALAATDESSGPARLWAAEEGEALASLLTTARTALAYLPDQPPSALPGLLDAMLAGEMVRTRRALRGRNAAAEHPRVFIWGLLEARLQSVETIVLGGLAETVWPPATDPGPWMSRPMRARAGLPSPEERVGQAAHDFVMAACAAPVAVLSCPRRRDSAPSVPARWLARIDAFLAGQRQSLQRHDAAEWARRLDQPAGRPRAVTAPQPRPALALRPRRLRVTDVQTWLEDPYAIYARYVLKLNKLRPLEEATDAADYGSLVHRGLELFLAEHGHRWPPGAPARLREKMDTALREADLRPALLEWWTPRLHRIVDWVCEQERDRRANIAPSAIATEQDGEWTLDVPGGFTLRGRADRIERRPDGTLAILDYKTGTPPSNAQVQAGFAPQLPLEAAMAAAGAFGPALCGGAAELTYWHLTGGYQPGETRMLFKGDADAIAEAVAVADSKLRALIAAFDDPARAYLSQPHPGRAPRFSDYGQLARVAEWDLSGDES
ncbi:MAG TPA: double-strand break repair protein AddB [Acetobacteraceae bacterium]